MVLTITPIHYTVMSTVSTLYLLGSKLLTFLLFSIVVISVHSIAFNKDRSTNDISRDLLLPTFHRVQITIPPKRFQFLKYAH
ncbi:hypothetical protein EJ08DRAFT_400239 [Tothia fuscella]|uniref:Uncharacterized protein n=1 Tax=Tothia fuscella TaxID=1048955 RepID=A0A9P4NKQ4_9PEZI|nr:hypothetical protein EJ08DRAFT_400239 [Tothia fuscella]